MSASFVPATTTSIIPLSSALVGRLGPPEQIKEDQSGLCALGAAIASSPSDTVTIS
jgi:hypothetical protein